MSAPSGVRGEGQPLRSNPPATPQEAKLVDVPNAFESFCREAKRCDKEGRLFTLPLSNGQAVEFVVVEQLVRGVDDAVYARYRQVWEAVPRGSARVFVKSPQNTSIHGPYELVGAVNGQRKFGYSNSTYGSTKKMKTVVAMEKTDGDCGHISAFSLPPTGAQLGQRAGGSDTSSRFWIIGSKLVHVVVDYAVSEACLAYYTRQGDRYTYAVKIARQWREMLPSGGVQRTGAANLACRLTEEQALKFHTILQVQKLTSCFEAIFADSQHLIDYNGANELRFYAFTSNERAFQDGLCFPVNKAEALYKEVGLPFSPHKPPVAVGSTAFTALLDEIYRQPNLEEYVLYGANGAGKVVRMWKEKTYAYTMELAAQEAILNEKLAGSALSVALKKKMQEMPAETQKHLRDWELKRMPRLLQFADWLHRTNRLTGSTKSAELTSLRNHWISLQKEF